jgi:hypothetical protein
MQERFGTVFNVTEVIEEALAHVNSKKWTDKEAYVRGWLRREAARYGVTNGTPQLGAAQNPRKPGEGNPRDSNYVPIKYHTTPFVDGKPILGK